MKLTAEATVLNDKTLSEDVNNASQTATTYITAIDENGIKVHASNNVNSNYAKIDADGMDIYKGGTRVASYGDDVVIGEETSKHIELTASKYTLYGYTNGSPSELMTIGDLSGETDRDEFEGDGSTTVFHLTTSNVTPTSVTIDGTETTDYSVSGAYITFTSAPDDGAKILVEYTLESSEPYMTLGNRLDGSTVKAYSLVAGKACEASGNMAQAFGCYTAASNYEAHAEGYKTTASGAYSHAEGFNTTAGGAAAHAQNYCTTAAYSCQTAIGQYNDNTYGNLFEIGNGTSSSTLSNAFTVDISGNVTVAGSIKVDGHASAIGTVLTSSTSGTISLSGVSYNDLITLSAGTWIVSVSYYGEYSGIVCYGSSYSNLFFDTYQGANAGVVSLTSGTTIQLYANWTSGTSHSLYRFVCKAVRIV